MVDHLLFYGLLLVGFLWLGLLLYEGWARSRSTACPPPGKPATSTHKPARDSKPFLGLLHKPHCTACEQAPEPGSPAPLVPPARRPSSQGRPRQVDTSEQFCPTPRCAYSGWVGLGNIRANGSPSGGRWRQCQCLGCQKYFLETHGTPLHGKRVPPEMLVWAVTALAEGLGIRAVARVFALDPNTVRHWVTEVGDQARAVSRHFLHDVHVTQVQLDELFAPLSVMKAGEVRAEEAVPCWSPSPRWVWVALDPVTKLLLAIEGGARTLAMAQCLVHQVVQVLAPACVPLFLTDGFKEYLRAVLTHYGHWVQRPRGWATGRLPQPRWLPLPQLQYAQVVKQTRRRRLVAVSARVVFGTLAGIKQILAAHGWQITTAFVERVNLTLRQHVAAVGRRVTTLCKGEVGLRQQLALYHLYYNFCLPHASLRFPLPQPEPTNGTGSGRRWYPCTPAMAAGLTDHVWTLREVLGFRVPPWPQP
jgi:IS1 family transposase/transposase-like protein